MLECRANAQKNKGHGLATNYYLVKDIKRHGIQSSNESEYKYMANSKDQEEEILEEEYKRLLQNLNKYQHENQQVLVQQQAPGKEFCVENRDLLKDRV